MDRTRLIPPDAIEAAQAPIEGVDAPESSERTQPQDQKQFAENEGLTNTARPEVAGDVGRPAADPQEAARAAQRGRTA